MVDWLNRFLKFFPDVPVASTNPRSSANTVLLLILPCKSFQLVGDKLLVIYAPPAE